MVGCEDMGCDAMWLCDVGEPVAHDSRTLEGSIPMRGETLGCKTQKDFGELMQQYYDSVLQSALPHSNVTTTFSFCSRYNT